MQMHDRLRADCSQIDFNVKSSFFSPSLKILPVEEFAPFPRVLEQRKLTLRQSVESIVFDHLVRFVFTCYNSCVRATLPTLKKDAWF